MKIMKIFIRYLASIFKRLSSNASKKGLCDWPVSYDVTLQAVEASRDLVVKSDALLTLFLHINRLWIPLSHNNEKIVWNKAVFLINYVIN